MVAYKQYEMVVTQKLRPLYGEDQEMDGEEVEFSVMNLEADFQEAIYEGQEGLLPEYNEYFSSLKALTDIVI